MTPDASAQIRILIAGVFQGPGTSDEMEKECFQAINEIKAMGPEVVPQIADALRALPPDTDGCWLGLVLIDFGKDAASAGEAVLSRLVLGTNTAFTMAAVLDAFGPEGHKLLLRALAPDQVDACILAAIGKLDTETEALGMANARLVNHKNAEVRMYALLNLQETGELGRSHLEIIRQAFRDKSEDVRAAAVETAASLVNPGDRITADALGELLLVESEPDVVSPAIKALLSIGLGTPTVRQGLERVAGGEDSQTKTEAVDSLRELFQD